MTKHYTTSNPKSFGNKPLVGSAKAAIVTSVIGTLAAAAVSRLIRRAEPEPQPTKVIVVNSDKSVTETEV